MTLPLEITRGPDTGGDANLIAAAPELLAELKLARERMLGSSPTLAALRAQTDAALRKATGPRRSADCIIRTDRTRNTDKTSASSGKSSTYTLLHYAPPC